MIPDYETFFLSHAIRQAEAFGARGAFSQGYAHLEAALSSVLTPFDNLATGRAEPLDPWVEQLADGYRRALRRYARRYGRCRLRRVQSARLRRGIRTHRARARVSSGFRLCGHAPGG
jgi:hypothetical protein